MCARFLNRKVFAALAILAAAPGSFQLAQAGGNQQGEKIQFSDVPTPSPVVVSNLNKLAPSEGSFKQVKEDLFRPFGSLDPRNSLIDNALNPPLPVPQRPVQAPMSKRTLEMLDKRRNWAFTSYEELYAPQDEVERRMFGIKEYGADGLEKKSVSAVDKYYDSLATRNLTATNQTAEEARAEFIIQNGFDPLGKTFRAVTISDETFRLETPDAAMDVSGGSFLTRALGSSQTTSSTPLEQNVRRVHQSELDMLRRNILGDDAFHFAQAAGGVNPLLTPDDAAAQKPVNSAERILNQPFSVFDPSRPKTANPFVLADPTANVLHSHVNDDLTARALGMANPSSTFTNNLYTRPAPTAQSIEAEHDPFAANRPKPRF
jgi:hypothetical protein